MKHRVKAIIKSCLSLALVAVMVLSTITINKGNSANAATSYTKVRGEKFVGSDGKWYYYHGETKVLKYAEDGSVTVEQYANPDTWVDANTTLPTCTNALTKFFISDGQNLESVYCMERAVAFGEDSPTELSGIERLNLLPVTAQEGIKLALLFGWHDGMTSPIANTNEDDYRVATQMIIWEYEQQVRTSPTTRVNNSYGVDKDTYYCIIKDRPAEACYNYILDCIADYYTVPSFLTDSASSQKTYEMTYDPKTKTYSVTLTDTYNTGVDLDFTSTNLYVTRDGNKYTFTSKTNSNFSLAAKKKIDTTAKNISIWSGNDTQTMINGANNSLLMYTRLTTPANSNVTIYKSSEDNVVAGIKFQVKGTGYDKTFTTDSAGVISASLPAGTYTIKEVDVPNRYNSLASQTVTVEAGKSYKLNFVNTLKPATVTVTKTAEDDKVEGLWFHIYGTALNGKPVNRYAQTNANGVATFSNVPLGNEAGYTVEEYATPNVYNAPSAKNVKVTEANDYNLAFHNELAKGTVIINKSSNDGKIEDFTFRLTGTSASGMAVNLTAQTDANGKAVFNNVPISGLIPYTITEELTSAQEEIYYTPTSKNAVVVKNTNTVVTFTNSVLPVNISVTKTSSDNNVEGIWFKMTGTDVSGTRIVKYATTNEMGIATFGSVKPSDNNGYTITEYFAPSTDTLEFTSVSTGTIAADKQSVVVMATKPGDYTVSAYNVITPPAAHTFSLMIYKESQDNDVENAQFIAVVFPDDASYNEFLNTGSTVNAAKAYVLTADSEGIASITNEVLKDKLGNDLDPSTATMHLVTFEVTSNYLNDMINQYMTATSCTIDEAKAYLEGKGFKFTYDYDKYKAGYIVSNGTVSTSTVAASVLRDGGVYSAHFYNALNTVDIDIVKTSDDDNVSNIEFELTCTTTGEVFKGVTDASGNISFENMPIGTYKLSEINPDPNHYENLASYTVATATGSNNYNINDTFEVLEDTIISAHNTVIVPSYGWLRITKTADDNIVKDVSFNISGTSDVGNAVNVTVTTNELGIASISLPVGTYTVTELNIPDRYVATESQNVIILKSEITDINTEGTDDGYGMGITDVIFHNTLKKGSLEITKNAEDNAITNVEFHIFGTSDNGIEVSLYASTNESGIANFKDLYPGTYTVEEVNLPVRYEVPDNKTVIITANNKSSLSFSNNLKEVPGYIYKELYYMEVLGDNYDLEINDKHYVLKHSEEHEANYEDIIHICNKENNDLFKNYIKIENGTYDYAYTDTIVDSTTVLYQFFDLPSYDVNYWFEVNEPTDVCINNKYFAKKLDESILNTKVAPLSFISYGKYKELVGVSESLSGVTINNDLTFKSFDGYTYNATITKNELNVNQGGTASKSNHVIIDLYYTFEIIEEPPVITPPDVPNTPDVEAGDKGYSLYMGLMFISGIVAVLLMGSAIKSFKKAKI